ncbi:MAG: acyl-CoA thioesterase [Bacteroidales bacterium]|nr:acyl-CoA thioesterase [Bacteroidales bacterium]
MSPYIHKVKYYECDPMGITHHSNYVRFMEEARVDFLDQLGYGFEKMEAEGVVSPVLNINVKYIKPSKFQDEISISVCLEKTSALKYTFHYVMKIGETTICTGESIHCFMENGRPVVAEKRFPGLAEALGKFSDGRIAGAEI